MITVKQIKKFRNDLISSGIPLSYFMQEKREIFEIAVNDMGEVESSISGAISGFNTGAYHQSGSSFCFSTDSSIDSLAEVYSTIESPLSISEKFQENTNIYDKNEKIGKSIGINHKDIEFSRKIIDEYKNIYTIDINIWERYIETISLESILRNDKQKYYYVHLSKNIDNAILENQFIARTRSDAKQKFEEIVEKLNQLEQLSKNEKKELKSKKYNLIFTPFAMSQFLLMLLSNSFILTGLYQQNEISNLFGKKIASSKLNIIDDPTIPGGAGSFLIDENGNLGEKRSLVTNGEISGFISNSVSAIQLGIAPGPCRSLSFMSEPLPAFSNIYIVPDGYMNFEDIKNQFNEGIIINSLGSPFLAEKFGLFKVDIEIGEYFNRETSENFFIENCIIKTDIKTMLNKIGVLGSDLQMFSGLLVNFEEQTIPQGFGAPTIGFEDINVEQY